MKKMLMETPTMYSNDISESDLTDGLRHSVIAIPKGSHPRMW